MDISKVLNLRKTVETSSQEKVTAISQPEFSGEWIRSKNYICSPCGEIFQDFLALLDHQQNGHSGVSCTHIQLDQSTEAELADELKRQIMRSGNGGQILPLDTFQCTKCHFSVESIPELHSHILLCSNHVSASPYRKRRVKVNPRSRRGHWNQNEAPNGGSRGLQRTNSSLTKNSSAARSLRSRSPKEG
jgi:DNA-directed RNA polymerase subunit RPC12/RpoP